jgi:uncharacterized protein YbaR (Trm112 family)
MIRCPLCKAKLFSCSAGGGSESALELVCRRCKRRVTVRVRTLENQRRKTK